MLLVSAVGLLIGYSVGGPITIQHLPESGAGVYASQSTVNGWSFVGVSYWTTPNPAPTQLSGTAGTPTVLGGAGQSYAINPDTAGDYAVSWNYTEEAILPISTEFEFVFLVGTAGLSSVISVKVYLETQFLHLFALTFDLFADLGTGTSSSLPIDSVQVSVHQCTSIGNCP
ncbi:MAG: hypothetical protein L3K04_03460 [Thermoplasmata archaeon]|nr:hypothetical protein [Thermoplasmata archaeon]